MAKDDHSFTPGNDSLVDRYLRARLDGNISGLADARLFHDADVCSARPHDLVRDHLPARVPYRDAGDGQQWYFFSPARFVGKSTTKRSRTVAGSNGKESWHSEGSPKPVDGSDGGQVQKFSYHIRTAQGSVEKPGWIMAEYSFKDTKAGDLVLCKVYKSPRGPGRSRASSSSSSTSSANAADTKRKAADDDEHLVAATPITRPRLAEEDDNMLFAENIERDLLASDHDHMAAPQLGEATQHLETATPRQAEEDDIMLFAQNIELDLLSVQDQAAAPEIVEMQNVEPEGQPAETQLGPATVDGYADQLALQKEDDTIQQQQDATFQTVFGPLSEYNLMAALAAGITVDELLLDGPSTSCPHPGGPPMSCP